MVFQETKPIPMLDIIDFYRKMEDEKIILSFKGEVTSELLNCILQMIESKLNKSEEEPKLKKKVYHVLVECLQNLYHHNDGIHNSENGFDKRASLFMIGKEGRSSYTIITGNYILKSNVPEFRNHLEKINTLDKDELKAFYLETLNNASYAEKGGGGLGMIDIARKSGHKLDFSFTKFDSEYDFFSMTVKIST
ncbi:MAG: SiaB family protein kinase [Flavobacteriales bacterium]